MNKSRITAVHFLQAGTIPPFDRIIKLADISDAHANLLLSVSNSLYSTITGLTYTPNASIPVLYGTLEGDPFGPGFDSNGTSEASIQVNIIEDVADSWKDGTSAYWWDKEAWEAREYDNKEPDFFDYKLFTKNHTMLAEGGPQEDYYANVDLLIGFYYDKQTHAFPTEYYQLAGWGMSGDTTCMAPLVGDVTAPYDPAYVFHPDYTYRFKSLKRQWVEILLNELTCVIGTVRTPVTPSLTVRYRIVTQEYSGELTCTWDAAELSYGEEQEFNIFPVPQEGEDPVYIDYPKIYAPITCGFASTEDGPLAEFIEVWPNLGATYLGSSWLAGGTISRAGNVCAYAGVWATLKITYPDVYGVPVIIPVEGETIEVSGAASLTESTNSIGYVEFHLGDGNYTISFTVPNGYFPTAGAYYSFAVDTSNPDINHVARKLFFITPYRTIRAKLAEDYDFNWEIPDDATVFPDVTITLVGDINSDGIDEEVVVTTDNDGYYEFANLHPGLYQVTASLGSGVSVQTKTISYNVRDKSYTDFLHPVVPLRTISGVVINSSGEVQRAITVTLTGDLDYDGEEEVYTTITDGNGKFKFTGIEPTTYCVLEAEMVQAVIYNAYNGDVARVITI